MKNTVGAASVLDDSPGMLRMVQAFGRTAGTDELAVAASLLCQAWAVNVTRPVIAGLVGVRRVTDLGPGNTELLFDEEGRPAGASAMAPRYAALAGDRAAATDPWAEIVPDEDALFAWVRSRIIDGHLAALVDALADITLPLAAHAASVGGTPPAPRALAAHAASVGGTPPAPRAGRRLLWGNVAAATAGAFAVLSAADLPSAATPSRAAHLLDAARRLLHEPGSPIEGLADVFPVDHDGAVRLFVRRQTCCLRYRLPDAPRTCLSCRLLPEAERRRRITLKLAS